MKQKILRVLPYITTALIMALIFFFSSQTREESSALSSGLTRRIIEFFMQGASEAEKEQCLDVLHNIIRKCAHFVLYAMLGFSASGMFIRKKSVRMWAYAVAVCCAYAISDELHQSLVDGRGPMVSDVVLDTCGGGFGAAAFLAIRNAQFAIRNYRNFSSGDEK